MFGGFSEGEASYLLSLFRTHTSQGWENGFTTCVKHAAPTPSKGPPKPLVTASRTSNPRAGSSRVQAQAAASRMAAQTSRKGKTPEHRARGVLAREPSVLEYLMYWLCTAMSGPKTFKHPPVGNEPPHIQRELPCVYYDVRMKCESQCMNFVLGLSSLFP